MLRICRSGAAMHTPHLFARTHLSTSRVSYPLLRTALLHSARGRSFSSHRSSGEPEDEDMIPSSAWENQLPGQRAPAVEPLQTSSRTMNQSFEKDREFQDRVRIPHYIRANLKPQPRKPDPSGSVQRQTTDLLFPGQTVPPPADAELPGHRLLHSGGYIRQTSAGLFEFLPLGVRVIDKLVKLVDREMAALGAQKADMPALQSKALFNLVGRWDTAGDELIRFRDRKDAEFCLSPTNEEAFTQLVSNTTSSWRQLPRLVYQIGKKYRDEVRPRFGLLRGREFLMHDLYSFDAGIDEAFKTYGAVSRSFKNILEALGLPYVISNADSGNMGGEASQEFHLRSPVGEDVLLECQSCDYSSNSEMAMGILSQSMREVPLTEVGSDHQNYLDVPALLPHQFRSLVAIPLSQLAKIPLHPEDPRSWARENGKEHEITQAIGKLLPGSIPRDVPLTLRVVVPEGQPEHSKLVVLRADFDINLHVTKHHLGISEISLCSAEQGAQLLLDSFLTQQAEEVRLDLEDLEHVPLEDDSLEGVTVDHESLQGHEVLVDESVLPRGSDVDLDEVYQDDSPLADDPNQGPSFGSPEEATAAQELAQQIRKAGDIGDVPTVAQGEDDLDTRDFSFFCPSTEGLFRKVRAGELCINSPCGGELQETPAIEIAHIFNLGKKYTSALKADFLDEDSKSKVMHMGCYGMGVSRLMAAVAEISHDSKGIIWPSRMAPYSVSIMAMGSGPQAVRTKHAARELYDSLEKTFLEGDIILDEQQKKSTRARFDLMDSIGSPIRIVYGKHFLETGLVDVRHRSLGVAPATFLMTPQEVVEYFKLS